MVQVFLHVNRGWVGSALVSFQTMPATSLFIAKAPPMPWGDYGNILMHGMTESTPGGTPLLMRTGPFIPPISLPFSTILVTDEVRKGMEPLAFTGFEFQRMCKRRIVRIPWRDWDLDADEPAEMPETGEPEDYILKGKHDAATARELGDIWELKIEITPGLQIEGGSSFNPARYNGKDLCRVHPLGGHIYFSTRLKNWLQANYSEWIGFVPAFPAS
jgi:hypothetical protein